MIVLRKLCTNYSDKIIPSGIEESFFELEADGIGNAYDWDIKTVGPVGYNVTKITSLCLDGAVEFTKYASIGTRFSLSTNISILNGSCSLYIKNNEQYDIRCIIRVKKF